MTSYFEVKGLTIRQLIEIDTMCIELDDDISEQTMELWRTVREELKARSVFL